MRPIEKIKQEYAEKNGWKSWEEFSVFTSSDEVEELMITCYKEGFALGTNKYNATTLWNNVITILGSVKEINGYWKALIDLEEKGVIELDKIE